MNPYKASGNKGLFDEQEQLAKLSEIGNPLEMTNKVVDFEMFRAVLEVRRCIAEQRQKKQCRSKTL
ncbi:MAG: hypothetical protein LLF81_03845 [Porphyromonadaceae bacterium]|nr:hypothetical protein [Porphyromonadaceae bacterium]